MERKHAFVFAFLITGLIASNYFIFNSVAEDNYEKVVIKRAIDGDTLELEDGRKVRLANINSPEKTTSSYKLSMDYLKGFEGERVEMENLGEDKYRRTLARIYAPEYVNLDIVKFGFASKFLVDEEELDEFDRVERDAIENFRGIWRKSDYYGCFETEIDKKSEFVIIESKCGEINMIYWQLKDESRKIYTFKNVSFFKIILHSASGSDNNTDIFWGSEQNVWNNDRDSLYLFDSNGGLSHYESYGY